MIRSQTSVPLKAKLLFDKGGDVIVKNIFGETALIIAMKSTDHQVIVALLKAAGAKE